MLTDENLLLNRPHPSPFIGGEQRVYRFPCGNGLSVINGAMLHSYPFAWEIAVVTEVKDDGRFGHLTYDTPLTQDVEVFMDDDEANAFIEKAAAYFAERMEKANG